MRCSAPTRPGSRRTSSCTAAGRCCRSAGSSATCRPLHWPPCRPTSAAATCGYSCCRCRRPARTRGCNGSSRTAPGLRSARTAARSRTRPSSADPASPSRRLELSPSNRARAQLPRRSPHLCGGAEHTGLGEAVTGLLDPDSADGLKACRCGTRDVERIVVEKQHPLGWHLQHACNLCEGTDIGFEQTQLEGQEQVVKQTRERPCGDAVVPVQRVGVAEAARGDARASLANQLGGAGQRPDWPGPEGLEERHRTEFELPVSNHPG